MPIRPDRNWKARASAPLAQLYFFFFSSSLKGSHNGLEAIRGSGSRSSLSWLTILTGVVKF